ncbi:MAG: hypothetical protein PW896_11040 [Pseudomonas sp.]|jgi:hypothetical protein|uniref:hypothetical protein n=1 Tax=Pseudomonas sp. TaxID=306 RepID=UPI0023A1CA00|nr:hypothetical protein [Pseudomonas sp.]MDE1195690.1 hypothetical protein [Pseudomonas sp.]
MPYSTFSDAQVASLIKAIDSDGYAVLPGWASPAQLKELQTLVTDTVAAAGNDYVALSGRQPVQGSPLYDWGSSRDFIDLCRRITEGATGQRSSDTTLTQTLRCLTGNGGRRESLIFHYDSFVLTTIMPVCMPESGERGDLLMLPNRRRLRHSYLRNLVDKVLVDNKWVQTYLKNRFAMDDKAFTRIAMQPGHMYLFWGYRSLHTNLPVAEDALRATAVFHYHNVHGSSSLASRLRKSLGTMKGQDMHEDVPQT